jgi:pyridoxine 5-phosphate synthase
MTRLSVNINKIALLRNARGGNVPDLYQFALDCEDFGADGITIHPRPDQRHIRYSDVPMLRAILHTELNVEGNPSEDFLRLVIENRPNQCTLVPDAPSQITSNAGWDTIQHASLLKDVVQQLHEHAIRVAIFIEPVPQMVEGAKNCGADRIELYTGPFAEACPDNPQSAVKPYAAAAAAAAEMNIGVNAGHDLNLDNLGIFAQACPNLLEVSIGQALIADALYFGIEKTIQLYKQRLR